MGIKNVKLRDWKTIDDAAFRGAVEYSIYILAVCPPRCIPDGGRWITVSPFLATSGGNRCLCSSNNARREAKYAWKIRCTFSSEGFLSGAPTLYWFELSNGFKCSLMCDWLAENYFAENEIWENEYLDRFGQFDRNVVLSWQEAGPRKHT